VKNLFLTLASFVTGITAWNAAIEWQVKRWENGSPGKPFIGIVNAVPLLPRHITNADR